MTTNTFIVTLRDETTTEQLEQQLLLLLDTESVTAVEITDYPDLRELGPCPKCGHEKVSVMQPSEELWHTPEEHESQFYDNGFATGPILNIMCMNCETTRYTHPVDKIINYS